MASQLDKKLLSKGNDKDYPKVGDEVTIEYTGWLYDTSKADNEYKGNKFDSSVGRGDFKTQIGVGRVIQGWDQGVPQMSLGEKSRLTIPGHMAYGDRSVLKSLFFDTQGPMSALCIEPVTNRKSWLPNMLCNIAQSTNEISDDGFPGLIPKNATLIFDVHLKGINGKKA
ncbi:hypothetical protein H2200_008916 [Cladophialophora chaetospira]|uniref:peptidylprolyl isomerase n=1 Tax=Cladophialophora chaetospira TaxID=386627 RepID=A0AA38X5D4_9EURO|nr:hypothetical protein H2200_008916 [Cladophialophora chaetospira]